MNFIKEVFYDWLQSVKKNKGFFILWIILSLGFGLIGVWLPFLNDYSNEVNIACGNIIINGSLSTYAIVILVDAIINVISNPKIKKDYYLIALILFTALVFLLNVVFYIKILDEVKTSTVKWITFWLGIISTFLSIYMYKYKKIDPEEGADAIIDDDNERVIESSKNETENPIL